MVKIGDLARLGQVSVRMLRHYDRIGLLRPAAVDPFTGHRRYSAEQLADLNRIVALKDLGLSLDQVGQLLAEQVSAEEIQGMLRLRRQELAQEVATASGRLAAVESRLRLIEKEDDMSHEFVLRTSPARRVAAVHGHVPERQSIIDVVPGMFEAVSAAVSRTGGCPDIGVAEYLMTEDGMQMTAGFDYSGAPADGFEVLDLPELPDAVCGVHLGSMATVGETWQALARWLEAHGLEPIGACREIHLESGDGSPEDDQSDWVTEIVQPATRRPAGA